PSSARQTRATQPGNGSGRKPAEPDAAADAASVRHRRGITPDRTPVGGARRAAELVVRPREVAWVIETPERSGPCDEPALPSEPGGTPAGFGLCAFGPGWRERSPPIPTVTTGPAAFRPRPVGGDPARAD